MLAWAGGGLAVLLAGIALIASVQISGCCGGSPTHGCQFIESHDAAADVIASDAPVICPFAPCGSGQMCCFEPTNVSNPLHCISIGGQCMGTTGSCASDKNCPAGSGMHCCGNVATLSTQCQTGCSGHVEMDQTVRICASSGECPAELPNCTAFTVQGRMFYGCSQ